MPRCSAKCQFRTHAPQQTVSLFDDFAGASEQRRRHGDADRFRSLHVDYKLVLGRCLHKLKPVRRIKAGHMLLATAAWLAKAREKRKNSCRFGVHSENLGYVYFLY
jgi:hypothetical protein